MKCYKKIACIVICSCLSSCSWWPILSIRFYNETSMPVNVSYMYFMGYATDQSNPSHELDTICQKIDAGKKRKIKFWGYDTKDFVSDSSYVEFIKLETQGKSVCFRDSDEIGDFFYRSTRLSKFNIWGVARGRFVITDSLFNSKK